MIGLVRVPGDDDRAPRATSAADNSGIVRNALRFLALPPPSSPPTVWRFSLPPHLADLPNRRAALRDLCGKSRARDSAGGRVRTSHTRVARRNRAGCRRSHTYARTYVYGYAHIHERPPDAWRRGTGPLPVPLSFFFSLSFPLNARTRGDRERAPIQQMGGGQGVLGSKFRVIDADYCRRLVECSPLKFVSRDTFFGTKATVRFARLLRPLRRRAACVRRRGDASSVHVCVCTRVYARGHVTCVTAVVSGGGVKPPSVVSSWVGFDKVGRRLGQRPRAPALPRSRAHRRRARTRGAPRRAVEESWKWKREPSSRVKRQQPRSALYVLQ